MKSVCKHTKIIYSNPSTDWMSNKHVYPLLGTRNSVHKDACGICCIIPESPLQMEMFSSESFTTEDKLPPKHNSNSYLFSRALRL